MWKDAIIVPVSKSSCSKTLNYLRSGFLTSSLINIFERFVKTEILKTTECFLNLMQFACRSKRGVRVCNIYLDKFSFKTSGGEGVSCETFVDSSVFNKSQPHILVSRLPQRFKLSDNLVGWI